MMAFKVNVTYADLYRKSNLVEQKRQATEHWTVARDNIQDIWNSITFFRLFVIPLFAKIERQKETQTQKFKSNLCIFYWSTFTMRIRSVNFLYALLFPIRYERQQKTSKINSQHGPFSQVFRNSTNYEILSGVSL
jgi:hypothetical protein